MGVPENKATWANSGNLLGLIQELLLLSSTWLASASSLPFQGKPVASGNLLGNFTIDSSFYTLDDQLLTLQVLLMFNSINSFTVVSFI